ncbi:MAG: hypothetical protein R3D59_11105 [Paracoccaceae bacterium]
MVDLISTRWGSILLEAYMLCSVCGDLRIPRSSTCRTGWCPSTCRGWSLNDRSG